MSYPTPGQTLARALAPLVSTFGERLSFSRDGRQAQWSFDGHVVIVEADASDGIAAQFVAPPETDLVSGRPIAAIYEPSRRGYTMTTTGCERMVDDMIAFFSGTREPRFTFVAAG